MRSLYVGVGALASTLALAACSEDGEPSSPCEAIALETPRAAWLADSDTVLVTSDERGRLRLVRRCIEDCDGAELEELSPIDLNFEPSQLLVTADGETLLYAHGRNLGRLTVATGEREDNWLAGNGGVVLIGALRSGSWMIYRDADALWAVRARPGDRDPAPIRLADGSLRVVALGDDHVVLREIQSARRQVLYTVPVREGADPVGDTKRLGRGDFRRVIITRGPNDPGAPPHQQRADEFVVATSGQGAAANTAVFDAEDGGLIDSFPGEVVSSQRPLEDLPGLDPVSPDASHLAYVTPAGSVALRDLQGAGSCVVAPHTVGEGGIAGFGRDGTLYYEFEEARSRGRMIKRVFAYDPAERISYALSDERANVNLFAVPAQRKRLADGRLVPWATGVLQRTLKALQPGAGPGITGADVDTISFLPRVDAEGDLWLLHAEQTEDPNDDGLELRLERLAAREATADAARDDEGELEIQMGDTTPLMIGGEAFVEPLSGQRTLCVTAPRPGAWSTACTDAQDLRGSLFAASMPPSERGDPDDPRNPQ